MNEHSHQRHPIERRRAATSQPRRPVAPSADPGDGPALVRVKRLLAEAGMLP